MLILLFLVIYLFIELFDPICRYSNSPNPIVYLFTSLFIHIYSSHTCIVAIMSICIYLHSKSQSTNIYLLISYYRYFNGYNTIVLHLIYLFIKFIMNRMIQIHFPSLFMLNKCSLAGLLDICHVITTWIHSYKQNTYTLS